MIRKLFSLCVILSFTGNSLEFEVTLPFDEFCIALAAPSQTRGHSIVITETAFWLKRTRLTFASKGNHAWLLACSDIPMISHIPLNYDTYLLWKVWMYRSLWAGGTQVQSLGQEDPLKKEMATHSSTLAWKIPWMEEPGGLQSMRSQRVGHNWVTSLSFLLWAGELIPKLMNPEGCLTGLRVPPLSRTLRGESSLGQTGSTRPGAQLSWSLLTSWLVPHCSGHGNTSPPPSSTPMQKTASVPWCHFKDCCPSFYLPPAADSACKTDTLSFY